MALAITLACQRVSSYLFGALFMLVPVLAFVRVPVLACVHVLACACACAGAGAGADARSVSQRANTATVPGKKKHSARIRHGVLYPHVHVSAHVYERMFSVCMRTCVHVCAGVCNHVWCANLLCVALDVCNGVGAGCA